MSSNNEYKVFLTDETLFPVENYETDRARLIAMLTESTCDIVYRKNSGETRYATGTRDHAAIGDLLPIPKHKTTRSECQDTVCYFDFDAQDWRSFRIDQLVSIRPMIDNK